MIEGGFWWRLVHLEPALIRGLAVAVVGLLGSVGILVIPGLPDGLVGVWLALAAIVQALWTKGAVTANARVAVRVPDPVNAPFVVEAGEAATTAPSAAIVEAARAAGP
jgi:hypothetical protein